MSDTGRQLLEKALRLPEKERARIAAELLHSLEGSEAEDPHAVATAWDNEIVRRAREVKAGTAKTEPWPAVEARIKRQLRTRRRTRSRPAR